MTKAELIREIERKTGVDKETAGNIIESFMVEVKDSLSSGEAVYLRGFGTFELKHRAAKTARDISKNVTIIVPEHDIPYFRPSRGFIISGKKKD